jgi:peptidyl-prolyl cis-trans isomerase SurA
MEKIPTYYIHVEDEFKTCGNISKWLASMAKQ